MQAVPECTKTKIGKEENEMANAETTYADRVGRAELLNQTTGGFIPAFTPSDGVVEFFESFHRVHVISCSCTSVLQV